MPHSAPHSLPWGSRMPRSSSNSRARSRRTSRPAISTPSGPRAGPELPARGLPLRLGAETRRLTHEDDGQTDTAYREVAGVLLLARRGKNANDIASRQWRALTAGAAMVGELGDRLFTPEQV